jgi:hypothetical protein
MAACSLAVARRQEVGCEFALNCLPIFCAAARRQTPSALRDGIDHRRANDENIRRVVAVRVASGARMPRDRSRNNCSFQIRRNAA